MTSTTGKLDYLRVFKCPVPKARFGKANDGGYIVAEMEGGYDLMISGGVSNDMSFEDSFLAQNPTLKAIAFDGTVEGMPHSHPRIIFFKKNLGLYNTEHITNLKELIAPFDNIFLKMDIEGGENDLFSALNDFELTKFKQIVIEFHSAEQAIIPRRLARTHWLVHFHPNNNEPIRLVHGINVPNVFECTYIRKSNISVIPEVNTDPIPNPEVDMINNTLKPEISVSGYPFTA